jgi:hypothetical protein
MAATALALRATPDRLYELLPTMYREADAEQGYPLRALLALVEGQANLVQDNVRQLWDNVFIETCARWAIPYIGELVGNSLLHDVDPADVVRTAQMLFDDLASADLRPSPVIRRRADVARTIYYRRRKGTVAMLEELARDVSGWAAHAVEFFQLVNATQHLNHLRAHSLDAPDLRPMGLGDRVQGPFDETSHTIDVRRIAQSEGWHNIRNVGVFLWRLGSYPVQQVPARRIGPADSWRYTFSPLGDSRPLFAQWRREAAEVQLTSERDMPSPIRWTRFCEDLRRFADTQPKPAHTDLYGDPSAYSNWSFAVFENRVLVPATKIRCVNLDGWDARSRPKDDSIGIDVTRGRLAVGEKRVPQPLTVSFHYGFSADMGSGPYPRSKWLMRERSTQQRLKVGRAPLLSLDDAIDVWAPNASRDTVITIVESGTFPLNRTLMLDQKGTLTIEAASGVLAHIHPAGGVIPIGAPGQGTKGSTLTLGGLLVEGGLVVSQDLQRLRLLHTTLVPGRSIAEQLPGSGTTPPKGPSLVVAEKARTATINTALRIEIAFSITGPLRIPAHAAGLWLLDSIVDGTAERGASRVIAIADSSETDGPPASIERSTVMGAALFHKLPLASESIFCGTVTVARQQEGCVRFTFVPRDSVTPRQYRCQPALEIAAEPAHEASIVAWMHPEFTAEDYGHPGYLQLSLDTPRQIRTGAADGTEMGAFNHLKQPQRETNLRVRFDEYLPFGLDAGLIDVT